MNEGPIPVNDVSIQCCRASDDKPLVKTRSSHHFDNAMMRRNIYINSSRSSKKLTVSKITNRILCVGKLSFEIKGAVKCRHKKFNSLISEVAIKKPQGRFIHVRNISDRTHRSNCKFLVRRSERKRIMVNALPLKTPVK